MIRQNYHQAKTAHTDKRLRKIIEAAICDLPNDLAKKVLTKVQICQHSWYTWFLGFQTTTNLDGAQIVKGEYFNNIDVYMHKLLPFEYEEIFEGGFMQRTNLLRE